MVRIGDGPVRERISGFAVPLRLIGRLVAAAVPAAVTDPIIVVAADRGYAETPDALDHTGGVRPVADEVSEAVGRGTQTVFVDVRKHRIERGRIAVDVGDEREALHRARHLLAAASAASTAAGLRGQLELPLSDRVAALLAHCGLGSLSSIFDLYCERDVAFLASIHPCGHVSLLLAAGL
jgi:predicted small lipoprotein YifL